MEETNIQEQEPQFSMDEQAMLNMIIDAKAISQGRNTEIEIEGRKYTIRPTSTYQNTKMLNLDFDVRLWLQKVKNTDNTRKAKRLNAKIRKAWAKKAAHKLLGRWLVWIPFAHTLTWLWLYNNSEKITATINSTHAISADRDFYLANLGSSKQALVLSMTQVGESVKKRINRGESAENMVEKDGSPKTEASK